MEETYFFWENILYFAIKKYVGKKGEIGYL